MNSAVEVDTNSVLSLRNLTDSTYILRFSRGDMTFRPGQHISVGLPGTGEYREYSIYSGIDDKFLEILVREVEDGMVSKQLRNLRLGDEVEVRGPYGMFMGKMDHTDHKHVYLIASGTGIAPFHSMLRSYPEKSCTIIHGVRNSEEAYERDHYAENSYKLCASRDKGSEFSGRLTDYLLEQDFNTNSKVYLCGNSNMIFDAMDILRAKGFPQNNLFTEVYF